MVIVTEKIDTAAAGKLLFAIPETLGMFAFGIGLVCIAVLIRWFIARTTSLKLDQKES